MGFSLRALLAVPPGGYTDLACLIPCLIAVGLALATDITEGPKRRRMIMLGVSLYLCFLLRRWFIFAAGAFYLSYFIVSLGRLNRASRPAGLKFMIINLMTAGLTNLLLMMIFQFPVLRGMIFNNYGELYAAYQMPLSASWGLVYSFTGPVVLALAAAGPIAAFIRRKHVAANVFALLCPVIYFIGFTRIQGLNPHHTLAITFFIWLLAFGGLIGIYQALPGKLSKSALCLVMTVFMIVGFRGVFPPGEARTALAAALPGVRIQPVTHPDFEGLKSLLRGLEQLIAGSADKVAVLAATADLNHDLTRNLLGPDYKNNILISKDIDQRDGISVFQLVAARYVIVTDPVEGAGQFVVTVPAEKILSGEGLGRAYRRVGGGYSLGRGVTGYIYEKQRPFTREEVDDYFRAFPPGAENWFLPVTEDDKMMMTAGNVISDGQERLPFDREKRPGLYVIRSGSNPPTSVTLDLDGLSRIKLAFSLTSRKKLCGGRAVVAVNQPGLPPETVSLAAGEDREVELDLSASKRVTLSAGRDSGPGCDYVRFRILEKQ